MRILILITGTVLVLGTLSLAGTASADFRLPRAACEIGGGAVVDGVCVGGIYDGRRVGR